VGSADQTHREGNTHESTRRRHHLFIDTNILTQSIGSSHN